MAKQRLEALRECVHDVSPEQQMLLAEALEQLSALESGQEVDTSAAEENRQRSEELVELLQRERRMLRAVMENTHVHLAYLDPQFNFVRVNSAYARGAGYAREELIGRNHFDLFPHPENRAIFERVRDTGEPVTFHARPFVYPERPELGTTYWDWTLVPVKGEGGRVQGLVFSLLDVTERERTREMLRQYADRLQVLHEVDQAILVAQTVEEIADATLRYVPQLIPCQRASVVVFDLDADEMTVLAAYPDGETRVGKGWRGPLERDWVDRALGQGRACAVEDVLALQPTSPLVEALQAEGVRAYVSVLLVAQGEPVGFLNLGMDTPGGLTPEQMEIACELADQLAVGIQQARLHERVRDHADELEKQVARRTAMLRARGARLRAIFENTVVGIGLVNGEGRVLESNPALQEMLGYDAEELRGMHFTEFTHPDDVMAEEDLFEELTMGERGSYRVEKRYVRKDGGIVWADLSVSIVRGAKGEPRFAIGMVGDITQRKQAQAALVQAEKMAITGRLAASLAHEINNPLQSVIGCLGLAQETLAEGGDAGHYLQIALEELRRAAGIVVRLRDLHRRSKPEEREPTDVNELLEQVLVLSRKKCEDRGIEVVWEAGRDMPSLMLVPDRMRQVFLNLVLNAIDAMPEGGRLQVSTSRSGQPSGIYVTFTDTGVGISSDILSQIFDPFYTTKPDGLGVGLYVSQRIVEEHGGRIEVESQVGEGATFMVWLPDDGLASEISEAP
jgi:PAS domain S-box-containing protein